MAADEVGEWTQRHNQGVSEQREMLNTSGWWHSIDLGDGRITPGAHPLDELRDNYARFNLPADLSGKRVLDIGCWDGFYSFEAERRGAEVVAIDCWRPETFFYAHRALGSRIEFHELSIYELSLDRLGTFDIVLFLGVLYHLPYPLLALKRVCEMTRDLAVIESHIIDHIIDTPRPVMEFYEVDELGGQYDNWWGPNLECLMRMARAAGFARTELLRKEGGRGVVKGYRRWEQPSLEPSPSLRIRDVVSAIFLNHHLPRRGRFALLSIWVEGLPAESHRETVRVEVGGFGSHPISVTHPSNSSDVSDGRINRLMAPGVTITPVMKEMVSTCTQIIAPVPPGLGATEVKVRVLYQDRQSREFAIRLSESSEW